MIENENIINNQTDVSGSQNKITQDIKDSDIASSEKHTQIENSENVVIASKIEVGGNFTVGHTIIINNRDGSTNKLISVSEYLTYRPEAYLTYNDYLKQNKLPYYSRGQFLRETNQEIPDFITENIILNDLLNEFNVGCIISGEGGIGKTRLMYQVAKRAEQKYKYQTFIIEQNVQAVRDIFAQLKSDIHYLFVFDYIEENEAFSQFIDEAAKRQFHVKILGNCRNTHQWNDRHFIVAHYLNNENEYERAYQRRVTQKIMQPIWVQFLTEGNQKFYKTKPSFAVFLRFLFETKKSELDILDFPDFESWLIRRFELSLKDENIDDCIKAIILLPIIDYKTEEKKELTIRSFKRRYNFMNRLLEDGWLQETDTLSGNKRLDTVHDTIKDELFLHILAICRKKTTLIDKLINTLELAQNEKLENNWFRAIERVSITKTFTAHQNFFIDFFNECLSQADFLADSSIFCVSKTTLLTEPERFDIIVQNPNPFTNFACNQSFGMPLQKAMNYYNKTNKKGIVNAEKIQSPPILRTLADTWLSKNINFTEDGYLADRFISTYINLYAINEIISPFFNQFISNNSSQFGGFSLCSWLDQGGDKTAVESYLIDFLKQNAKDKDAQFILSAWLNNGGDKTAIESYVIDFLKQNAKDKSAQFVLSAWLNNGGDKTAVEIYLIDFLKQNAEKKDTRFVLSAWLNSGGEPKTVEIYLLDFLKQNAKDIDAPFVLSTWLNNGGDKTAVERYVIDYLKQNAKDKDAQFVLSTWLNNGGGKTAIEIYLIDYLKQNAKDKDAQFVLSAWLNNGGGKTAIEIYLIDFLKQNAEKKDTRFIISTWLNCGGEPKTVEIYLLDFLKKNAKEKSTSFVIQAWLERGGEPKTVEIYLSDFLKQNAKDKDAQFVLSAWLNNGGNPKTIKNFIIDFLNQNAKEKETSYVIQAWLKCGAKAEIITNYIYDYLSVHIDNEYSSFVLQPYIQKVLFDSDKIKPYVKKWLDEYLSNKNSKYLILSWLKKANDNKFVEPYIIKWLELFPEDEYASKIVEQWMENGGDIKTIVSDFNL
jgi:hypothetical protein